MPIHAQATTVTRLRKCKNSRLNLMNNPRFSCESAKGVHELLPLAAQCHPGSLARIFLLRNGVEFRFGDWNTNPSLAFMHAWPLSWTSDFHSRPMSIS